jgi:hypothetical protein
MGWLIVIGAYLLFLIFAYMFIRGGTIRECPRPQQADVGLLPLQQMQSATSSTLVFDRDAAVNMRGEMDLSTAPLAHSNM